MKSLLVIKSSVKATASSSSQVVDAVVQRIRLAAPAIHIEERDLGANPMAYQTLDDLGTLNPEAQAAIAQVMAADVIVIGAPMYNFGIPASLKVWLDHIIRAGTTFRYSTDGKPIGGLSTKKVIFVTSSGGSYPLEGDLVAQQLKMTFEFLGVKDMKLLRVQDQATSNATDALDLALERVDALLD